MNKILFASIVCCAFAFTAFTGVMMTSWNLSDDYVIRFEGRGTTGNFGDLSGDIVFDPAAITAARMNVRVAVNTISTGNKTKDKHALGSSWFDAEQFPTITLQSTEFKQTDSGLLLIGKLTMHGVTKAISLPFTFTANASGGIFAGEFTVNRQDYGIKGPFMAFTVSDEFQVQLKVPVKN